MSITGMSQKQGHDRAMAALRAQERGPRVFDTSGVQRMLDAHGAAHARISAKLAGKLDPQARTAYERAVSSALGEISSAWQDAQNIENRADLYPPAKREAIEARLAEADSKIREAIDSARATVDILAAEATVKALPQMPADMAAQERARADALMILDRTPANRRGEKMQELATRSDAIGALVSSEWGRDYAGAVLPDSAGKVHNTAVQKAIEAGRTSGDPQRAKAAEAVGELAELRGLADTVAAPWRHAREVLVSHDGAGRAGMG